MRHSLPRYTPVKTTSGEASSDYMTTKIIFLFLFKDPNHIIVSGHALAATAVGKMSFFTLSNVIGSLEDIEIAIDAPTGDSVSAQVTEISKGTFKAEFCPSVAGEHQIYVSFGSEPVPGSPFPCKVYNVSAIQVRECKKGIVGKPVTFLVETSQAGPGNLEVTGKIFFCSQVPTF